MLRLMQLLITSRFYGVGTFQHESDEALSVSRNRPCHEDTVERIPTMVAKALFPVPVTLLEVAKALLYIVVWSAVHRCTLGRLLNSITSCFSFLFSLNAHSVHHGSCSLNLSERSHFIGEVNSSEPFHDK